MKRGWLAALLGLGALSLYLASTMVDRAPEPAGADPSPEPVVYVPPPEPSTSGIEFVVVGDDDRSLEVTYLGGVETCYDFDRVDVAYAEDAITLSVWERMHFRHGANLACEAVAIPKTVDVRLEEPVAGREIRDGDRYARPGPVPTADWRDAN